MKSLIAYYSRKGNNYVGGSVKDLPVGNTEVAAGIIQKLTGGDSFKIDTAKAYPADYDETTRVAREELRQNARPELTGHVENMDDYDVVFLGYPNWWGTMPMAVFAFLEEYDFSGKTIVPFCTHEGSGMGHSESDIKKLCPAARVAKGLAIQGGNVQKAESAISDWLQKPGVPEGVKK
ncbi:MAG: flavodoxin [Rectinemataceae bacterium]